MSPKKVLKKTRARALRVRPPSGTVPVVGVGASAGGLQAIKDLLKGLGPRTGMAFVLVQHLDPKHESFSADIFSRVTDMPVKEVKQGVRVEANHIYVIPPNFGLLFSGGNLRLVPRDQSHGQRLIDAFFDSLAANLGPLTIGVVLSGTGKDGTQGLGAIRAAGGFSLAQTPKSARFSGMPEAAIATGNVDLVLSPSEMANELNRIGGSFNRPSFKQPKQESPRAPIYGPLARILAILREDSSVDFAEYKSSTIARRIERRMVLCRIKSLDDYAELLSRNPEEVKALFADILIHVTGFFRDPDAYEVLKKEVFPKLLSRKAHIGKNVGIRVWVPGCSTGEEAYSIAIALAEFLGDQSSHIPVQIFGTDISERAIQKARQGEFSESITQSVSPERLARFFVKLEGGGYQISKSIRDLCLFSRHDAVQDPPFAKVDLISCRNLLIYFSTALQKRVIPIFHYALNPKGFLLLGMSETISGAPGLFTVFDRVHKIYTKEFAEGVLKPRFSARAFVPGKQDLQRESSGDQAHAEKTSLAIERLLESEFPGVLINDRLEILEFRGRTAPYLEAPIGPPVRNLLKMAKPELHSDLRLAIFAARKKGVAVRRAGIAVKEGRSTRSIDLRVIPFKKSKRNGEYLVLFERGEIKRKSKTQGRRDARSRKSSYIEELEQKFKTLQEDQAGLIQRFESTHEDATAANEELQSANEELQSTNEELETAKEELQSGNEELTTVNDELQLRNVEQSQLNNDLVNLLGSVEIPILMLDMGHRIRRFTPPCAKMLNLLSSDIGRPVADLKLTFTAPDVSLDLAEIATEVARTGMLKELEVQDRNGHWFRLQARPYQTVEGRIDGAVIALVDIHGFKKNLGEVKLARNEAEQANKAKDLFLATLSHELRTPLTTILSWSQLLRSGKLDPQKAERAAAMIEESGLAQAQLINDLLDVSRIIMGKFSLELGDVDLAAVVRASIQSVLPSAESKAIEIVADFQKGLEERSVRADPARLQQVFWNLLTNAIKFSPTQSKVQVKVDLKDCGVDGSFARIQVKDFGKGIKAEFLPHLFDRFSQQDSSSVRLHGGLGLGLAIVKNLVELQGGKVSAESAGEGKGATFSVLLPLAFSGKPGIREDGAGEKRGRDTKGISESRRLERVRALVVEDDLKSAEAFREILASAGASVHSVASAREALRSVGTFKPDVLVSDIAMPEEDGFFLIREFRASEPGGARRVPCIALTAFACEEDRRFALAAGFDEHLGKPVDARKLVDTIADVLARRGLAGSAA